LRILPSALTLLKSAVLDVNSYEFLLETDEVKSRDFVYLDPPYPPASETASFAHYTPERFSWADQEKVAQVADRLRKIGCFVMISNSADERIRKLYAGWWINSLPVVRWIAANGTRHRVTELVISSYHIELPSDNYCQLRRNL
jgi:DNA adenine methylase